MRQRELARLLVKVAALVVMAAALMELPLSIVRVVGTTRIPFGLEFVGLAFAPVSISLLAGLAMFWWAGPIVDRTLVSGPAAQDAETLDLRGFEEIALTILGFYAVTAGLAEMVYYWAENGLYNDMITDEKIPKISPKEFGGLMAGATRILIGAVLVLCSRGFITLKRRLLVLRPMHSGNPPRASREE